MCYTYWGVHRVAFDEDTVPDLRGDEAIMQDIHCVASLLKMYFRELPNPLLTYQLYEELVASVSGPEEGRLARLRGVVRRLPPPHYRTLRHLLLHLARVAAHGHTTGMTPRNVAIVWAPNLLRSRSVEAGGGVAALHVIGIQAVLTEYLIRYADILFSHRAPALSPAPADSGKHNIYNTIYSPFNTEPQGRKFTVSNLVLVVAGRSRGRPKSLAVCTTRLLTLEEARSRVLAPQHFIDVGGGPPPRYHTILELPKSAKKSGWKSFFTRHSSTSRKHSGGSLLPTSPTAALQDQTILASKSLRPVKSAESLVLLSGSSCRNSREEEEEESFGRSLAEQVAQRRVNLPPTGAAEGSRQSSVKSSQSRESSGTIQKHGRSTSHDSYFDHPTTFELSSPDSPRESKKQKLDDRTVVERYGNKDTVIVEVHATHEPEKSSMEDDDEMFEEPIFIQRLSPISLPQLEQLCSGSTSQLHCETMDSSPEDIPFLPQQHSSEDTDPRPEGESSCAKSQSLLSSNDCSLKTTSFFFDSRVANPEVERPPREPDNPCKYPSPTDALSSSSSSTSTEGAGALLPSSSDLHIHEEEESPPCIEEGMLVDTKSSPLSLHFEPSQSSSNLELSTPESPPPHRDFLPHSEKPHVYLHSPNSMATSSQSSESLHSSHSSSQQSEAIPSLQDLTAFIGSSEALPSEKQGSDRQLQCTLHRDTQQSPPLQVAMHSEAQQIPPLLATQESPSEDTLHSEKQPPILSTLQSEITSPNQFTVQNEQYFPLQSTLQNELYSPSQSPVKTESQSTPQTEHYSPIQTELPSQPAVATELCTVHAELYFPPQSSPETELHSSSQSPVQTESDSPVETEICPSPQFPSVQAGLHSPDSTMDDATTQSEVHSQSTIPSSDSSPSPTHQVTPRQVDTGRSSNFRELFSKFEHSNTPNPPAALPDKVKPQLSLFTQLKILKLQSLSSPVAQSPQYDPWNNPILDRLNQEEVCSPTEPKVEQPPVLAKEPVKPVTSPVKETPPPQPKENNTPTTPK
ncbi:ARHGAP32, partial [Cordylochernes scorpioides]